MLRSVFGQVFVDMLPVGVIWVDDWWCDVFGVRLCAAKMVSDERSSHRSSCVCFEPVFLPSFVQYRMVRDYFICTLLD